MLTKEQAKEKLRLLIEKFKREIDAGKIKNFNEEQTKKDYIEPFFELLNWDMRNSDEVTVEEKISKGRVDYGFRMDDIPKFYVEAKAVKEDLNNQTYMEQAIEYAWFKSVTWAVLTNFEELKIFNAEWESKNPRDKIYMPLKWDEYLDKFDRIWLLSKDSFLNHELDKEAEEHGKKIKATPVTPVMNQIFNDLMVWREKLTKSIASYSSNNKIVKTEEELDEAVQRIIDRLIFIRVCEDKEIENRILESTLREWLKGHKKPLSKVLNDIFREFDKNYNSKLFAPHPSEELEISDSILIDVINNLYESSDRVFKYDFSAIESDVLGNIYEEYLGYILQKNKKKVNVTESHLQRKKMGIYYTPTFVVNYIVKNTVGKFLEESSKQVDSIKVLDMACGSGSFLLKTFDTLNDYHKNKNELDFLRKVKILTSNIYGVDLDPKALEIAQLNLLLKTLEKRKLLPKLQDNLKVGNSLIDDSKYSDRAFSWDREFNGKFDVVVGNPPYIDYRELEGTEFFKKKYFSAKVPDKYNILVLFIEKGLELLKENGRLGFIVSNQFLVSDFGKKLREFILKNSEIEQLIDVSNTRVFKDAQTYPIIIILRKTANPSPKHKIKLVAVGTEGKLKNGIKFTEIEQRIFSELVNNLFLIDIDDTKFDIIKKLNENSELLSSLKEEFTWGTSASGYGKMKIKSSEFDKLPNNEKSKYMKMIQTADIQKYRIAWQDEFLPKSLYTENKMKIFEKEKIVIGRLNKFLKATIDEDRFALGKASMLVLKKNLNIKFVLGVLNSKLMDFYYKLLFISTHMQGGYVRYDVPYLELLPIKNSSKESEKEISDLVDKILQLNSELQKLNSESDRGKKLQEEIKEIDKKIDQKIYELYDLTKDEIKIIEAG